MARTPISARPPVAQWLIRARETQTDEETGKPWTAERFLAELRKAGVKGPHRSNYAQWESGAVNPEDASLAPIVAFWSGMGVGGPDLPVSRVEAPAPDLATAILALAHQLEEMRAEVAQLRNEREAWQRGVLAVLRDRAGDREPDPLLAALVLPLS